MIHTTLIKKVDSYNQEAFHISKYATGYNNIHSSSSDILHTNGTHLN